MAFDVVPAHSWPSLAFIRTNFAESTGPLKTYIDEHRAYMRGFVEELTGMVPHFDMCQTHGFIERLLTDRAVSIKDPRSGRQRYTTSSSRFKVKQVQYVAYHFLDGPRMDLVMGYVYNFPNFIFYHDTNTILLIGGSSIMDELDHSKAASICRDIQTAETGYLRRKPVVWAMGDQDSVGHVYWQNLSGLDFLQRTGLISAVDGYAPLERDFYGIPAYLADVEQKAEIASVDVLSFCFSEFFVRKTARERALQLVPGQIWAKHRPPRGAPPSVMFQLRSVQRRWLGQVEGIASIILDLAEKHPSMIFYIDGRSSYVGSGPLEDGFAREEITIFEAIRSLVPASVAITSTIGWEIPHKIAAFSHLLAFCGPIGSGFIVPNWILNKRGVVYGPHAMYGWAKHQADYCNERLQALVWVPEGLIEPVADAPDPRNSDFNLDWRMLRDMLLGEIEHAIADLSIFDRR